MKVLEDPVVVRRGEEQSPEQFLWRGRLWSVRQVLERPSGAPFADPEERWRVRAAAGRLAALLHDVTSAHGEPGEVVVDLSFDWVTGDWRLGEVAR
ncbi:MAG: DUF6504 family protein [Marmoricola sp.]